MPCLDADELLLLVEGELAAPQRAAARLASFPLGQRAAGLAFHPDGRRLVTATIAGSQTWDLVTGSAARDPLPPGAGASAMALDHAAGRLAVA